MPGKNLRYLRCPACGKLSRPANFAGNPRGGQPHKVEARTQIMTGQGRGRGIRWTGTESLAPEERVLLAAALREAARRLG